MNKKKSVSWLQALHAMMSLRIGYIPVGLACGVLLQKVGFDPLLSGLLSILVFPGGTQFPVASMLTTQTSLATALLTVSFLELRYTLLGANLAGLMKREERAFLAVFSQSLNGESYVVNYLKFSTDLSWNKRRTSYVNWLSMTAWAGNNMIGNFFGLVIWVDADLVHFALTAMFIFMFIMQMRSVLLIFTGLFSGVLGVAFMVLFQNTFGLIVVTVITSFAGFTSEKVFKEEKAKKLRDHDRGINESSFNFPEQEANHHD